MRAARLGERGVGGTQPAGDQRGQQPAPRHEPGAVLPDPQLGNHRVADPAGGGVGDDPLEALPRADEDLPRVRLALAARHQQHHHAGVPAGVADLGRLPDAPRPADGQRHVGRGVVADGGERDHRHLGAGHGTEPRGERVDRGRRGRVHHPRDVGQVAGGPGREERVRRLLGRERPGAECELKRERQPDSFHASCHRSIPAFELPVSRWCIVLLLLGAACQRQRDVTVLASIPGLDAAGNARGGLRLRGAPLRPGQPRRRVRGPGPDARARHRGAGQPLRAVPGAVRRVHRRRRGDRPVRRHPDGTQGAPRDHGPQQPRVRRGLPPLVGIRDSMRAHRRHGGASPRRPERGAPRVRGPERVPPRAHPRLAR